MRIELTKAIRDAFPDGILDFYIKRFILGDYGNVSQKVKIHNEKMFKTRSGTAMGSYSIAGETVLIKREIEINSNLDIVTVLFPEEY